MVKSGSNPLDKLPVAKSAAFDSSDKNHHSECLPDTRVDVLDQITKWAAHESKECIFWLNGRAGTGKSTIALTVARRFDGQKKLGASFFFRRGGGDVSHAANFVTTVARQLAEVSTSFRHHVCQAIADEDNIASKVLRKQWDQLILRPMLKLDATALPSPLVIVIDALDECGGEKDVRLLLQLMAGTNDKAIRLRFFLTSRPETPIQFGFRFMQAICHYDLLLHEVARTIVDHDIRLFFISKFKEIEAYSNDDRPSDKMINNLIINDLVQKAAGLFIYAATVYRFVESNQRFSPRRLIDVFLRSKEPDCSEGIPRRAPFTSPTAELDHMYSQILNYLIDTVRNEKDKEYLSKIFQQVVGSIIILSEPLSATILQKLLEVDGDIIHQGLHGLSSLLDIPDDDSSPIRTLHASFRDFLLDQKRCSDPLFSINEKEVQQQLARCCLQRLTSGLKKDICGLKLPGILQSQVDRSRIEQHLPTELQYACRYWVEHLQRSDIGLQDDDEVHNFLREHFLHWLEAMSLIGNISEAILAITSLYSMVNSVSRLINVCSLEKINFGLTYFRATNVPSCRNSSMTQIDLLDIAGQ